MSIKTTDSARSWFCVLNNPSKLFGEMPPQEMVDNAIRLWCENKPQRTCAVNYEIGESGTPHMHMVLEDSAKARFSAIQKLFPTIHIEPTRGTKEQAEDYINKRGRFEEKNHTVVVPATYQGEIKANKGSRKDLEIINDLIENGHTPKEIFSISFGYRKFESMIRKAFLEKKYNETPPIREINVIWHVGESGTGKSYAYLKLCEKHGEENVFRLTDYSNGGFDTYEAEKILFMDEFKSNISFTQLLTILDRYKAQIHCRYANTYALWNEVHITSVFPPDEVYKKMVEECNRKTDTLQQLLRRITLIEYHYIENGQYKSLSIPTGEYTTYEDLKQKAHGDENGFVNTSLNELNPFNNKEV